MTYKNFIKLLQTLLNNQGEKLTVDGDPGQKTQAAFAKYDIEIIVKKKPIKDPVIPPVVVKPPVIDGVAPKYPAPHKYHPRFDSLLKAPFTHIQPIDVLRSVAGQKEIKGSKDNPLIAHFHEHSRNLGTHSDTNDYSDEVPHCASAINWACDMSGCHKTDSAAAASYSDYGNPRKGDWVEEGDIIHKRTGSQNHVTFANKRFNRKTESRYEGFGSNQNNAINTSTYKTSEIKSVQVPKPLPGTVLAPIGILGHKPVPSAGSEGSTT